MIDTSALPGDSLKSLIHGEPLPLEQILDVGCQIADALDTAHAQDIVHRDINPANIFITKRGQATLITSDTTTESVNYMSPEQARGEALDGRSDLFSLGLVLYEMATGRQAFDGQTTAVVVDAILSRDPMPTRTVNPAIPSELEHVITRALEKDRKMRYQTAADMLSELSRLRRDTMGRTVAAAAPPASQTTPVVPAARGPRTVIVAVVAIGVLAVGGFFFWRSTAAPTFTERDTILIADFANTTGDPMFGDALKLAVSAQLQQTPFVTLVADQSVQRALRLMARPIDEPLTSALARDLCQRVDAKATVEGSIGPLGNGYVINIGVHSCQTGASIAQEQVQASSKEEVLTQVGAALTGLRKGLGESLASIQKYDVLIADATTASLEALKAYGQAGRMRQTRGDEAALPFYQQAIQLDPNFALAYSRLGVVSSNLGREEEAKTYTQQAYDLRDRVSEYERFYITWSHATRVLNDPALARTTLELMTATYPRDFAARNNLGVLLMGQAQYEAALKEYLAAADIAPSEAPPLSNAAYALLFLGRYDEGIAMIERALAARPNSGLALLRWVAAAIRGDARAAEYETAARQLATPTQFMFAESNLAAWEGRLKDYSAIIEQLRVQVRANPDAGALQGLDAAETITMAVLQRGPWVARLKALANLPDLPPQGVSQIAAALAIVDEIDAVRRLLPRMEQSDMDDPQQAQPAVVSRALVASAEGRTRDATTLLETYMAGNPRAMDLHYYLGLVRERGGLIDEAIASYTVATTAVNVVGPSPAVMSAKLSLGLLLKKKGDAGGANAQFDDLLKQWSNADADFEMLKTVKANR